MKRPRQLEIITPREPAVTLAPDGKGSRTVYGVPREGATNYWELLWQHKITVLSTAFLSALVAFLVTLPQTPLYQAQTSLEIQGVNENFLHLNDLTPNAAMYTGDGYMQTQVDILESRSLIRRTALKAGYLARLNAVEQKQSFLAANAAKPPERSDEMTDKDLEAVSKRLRVRTSPPTRIVRVSFDSPDPRLAADFANTLAREYVSQALELRWTEAKKTVEGLSHQLEDLKVRLREAEDKLQSYTSSAGLVFLADSKGSVAEERLKELQDEYSKAQAERISRQSEYDVAQSGKIESLPRVLDSAGLTDTQQKLTAMRTQLAELSSELTPKHYKVQRLQAQIQTMESELNKGRANILHRIKNETQQAQQREAMLEAAYARQRQLVADQKQKSMQYDRLKHEADTDRALYDSLSQRVREAGIASAVQANNVRVIDAAEPPARPYKPALLLNVALGGMTGLFFGLVFVITRENYDRRVRRPGEATRLSNTPELGVVPFARGRRAEQGPLTDSVRSMLTSLVFAGATAGGPRLIVITSPGAGEGKTTILRNLGNALSRVSGRVLLVDADLYRPRLDTLFGISNFWGLSNLLQDTYPVDEYPFEALGTPCGERLSVLPSGPHCEDTAGLYYSPRLVELFQRLRREYDIILIDTPPMIEIPDARVLGRLSDGVILVLRSGQTTADALAECTGRLQTDGTLLLGTVLNGFNARPSGYGYYRRRRPEEE